MEVSVFAGSITDVEADVIVVNLFEGVTSPKGATGAVDKVLNGAISAEIKRKGFKGRLGSILEVDGGPLPAEKVWVVGLGPAESFGLPDVEEVSRVVAREATKEGYLKVATIVHGAGLGGLVPEEAVVRIVKGAKGSGLKHLVIAEYDGKKAELFRQTVREFFQREFVIIKPDGVEKNLIGEVISRFEKRGLRVVALKMVKLDRQWAEKLYEVHRGKPFFEKLIRFMTSRPIVAMVIEGPRAVEVARRMLGPTKSWEAPSGTIRGDYALDITENIAHASDSEENAKREMSLFFTEEEIYEW